MLPPSVLGEQTVLHPGVGSLVTVTAETFVEVVAIEKDQVDKWALTGRFVDDLKRAAVNVPNDETVRQMCHFKNNWGSFKASLLERIPKTHWPIEHSQICSVSGGGDRTVVLEKAQTFGQRIVKMK